MNRFTPHAERTRMPDAHLATVTRFAPAWVRYVLTLSEIARSDEGWVLAARENIAIMDAAGASAMPLWPYRALAESAIGAEAELAATVPPPEPTALGAAELLGTILPALSENSVSVAVYPTPGENRVIGPDGVARDLQAFIDEPRDIAAELAAEPHAVELEGWAELGVPDLGRPVEEADARFWLLAGEGGDTVVGVMVGGGPALALFANRSTAEAFAEETGAAVTARSASTESLVGHWLLMAFSAGWDVAIVADDGGAGAVKPVRLALDLARAAREAEEG